MNTCNFTPLRRRTAVSIVAFLLTITLIETRGQSIYLPNGTAGIASTSSNGVGIGTSTPNGLLDVAGWTYIGTGSSQKLVLRSGTSLEVDDSSAGNSLAVYMNGNAGSIRGDAGGTWGAAKLNVIAHGAVLLNPDLPFTSQVGIGTATPDPDKALTVYGTAHVTQDVIVGGTVLVGSMTLGSATVNGPLTVAGAYGNLDIAGWTRLGSGPSQKVVLRSGTSLEMDDSTAGNSLAVYMNGNTGFIRGDAGGTWGAGKLNLIGHGAVLLNPDVPFTSQVGIGTATPDPDKALTVYGVAHVTQNMLVDGVLQAGNANIGGALTVGGSFSAPAYVASNGTLTGSSTTGLTLNAGASGQNITLNASGGHTTLLGNVGIGTSSPQGLLDVPGWVYLGSGLGEKVILRAGSDLTIYDSNTSANASVSYYMDSGTANIRADSSDHNSGGAKFSVTATGGIYLNPTAAAGGGNVGIGTSTPDQLLTVNGTIHAKAVTIDTQITAADVRVTPKAWADDVFAPNHPLPPLSAVEASIRKVGHLPGIPSAADVAANGISVADMQAKLLREMEEMTLHLISQEKRIAALEQENAELHSRLDASVAQ